MESLIQIVDKLKQPELRMLRGFYKIKQNKEPSKKLELLNLITRDKVKTDSEAMERLYGGSNSVSGFSHLKERLKTDLLNTILFLHPEKIYSTLFIKNKLECRKLIIQAELLLNRSDIKISNDILLKALAIAEKFEFPDLEIQIRDTLRAKKGFEFKFEDFHEHNKRIETCIKLQSAILKSKEYYYYIQYLNSTNTPNHLEYENFVLNALTEIKQFIEDTKSVQIKYWYYLVAVPFYISTKKDHEQGIKLQLEFIKLIEKEVSIRSKSAIGGTNMQLAHIYLVTNDYTKALKPALKAVENFRKDSFNYLRALEFLFWTYFRTGDLVAAESTIENALNHKYINRSPHFSAKWKYLKANLMFLKGDLEAAHDYLLQSDELTKDKGGWYIGFKLLLIYITFEQENYYWLESQLENFRKLIARNKQANLKRAKVIHKVAHTLLQNHGDFQRAQELSQRELSLLSNAEKDMEWDPTGYEVVRFDDWFNKKKLNITSK
ncbi:MAG: hypothetical protein R3E32_02500 [Chitinophagales bacterium]